MIPLHAHIYTYTHTHIHIYIMQLMHVLTKIHTTNKDLILIRNEYERNAKNIGLPQYE